MNVRSSSWFASVAIAATALASAASAQPAPAACPAAFADFRDRVHVCRCSAAATGSGLVFGNEEYARTASVCRSALHAAAVGPEGGDVIVHVLLMDGEEAGADRNGVQSQAGRFDGRAFRPMAATPGNLDWARRAVVAYSTPNRPFPVTGQREGLVPVPPPQAAGLDNATLRAGVEKQPNFALVSPPVIMPAFWRTPVRPPDAPPPLPAAAGPPVTPASPPAAAGTAMPQPAPGGIQGSAQVLSTALLVVGGRRVALAHVTGVEGAQARGLAAFIARGGGTVTCEPAPPGPAMRCRGPDGTDLAEAALFNGGARVRDGAPESYRAAERAARDARRGIWAAPAR